MKRKSGESFADYQTRRKADQQNTKEKLQPRLLWASRDKGTYIKRRDGDLT